jgi:putative heme utilization carrier protein HutX
MTAVLEQKNQALASALAACLNDKKPVLLADLADRHGVTEFEVAQALPHEVRAFAPASALEKIWEELTRWERATFIMQHLGTVLEVKAGIPPGKNGHGYFNLAGDSPLGGHLKMDDLKCICFMSLPFMGLESLSLQFFNNNAEVKFSIYAGRDEKRRIIPAVRESFANLRETFCQEA